MPNSITAFNPTLWSRKSVAILRERISMPKLIRMDFSNDLKQAGDTVNTRKIGKMVANTVNTSTGVTVQNVTATNIPVTLNQHKDATFVITDREATSSFENLVEKFLDPAMLAIANNIDVAVLGLYTDVTSTFPVSSAGDWKAKFSAIRVKMNKNLAPVDNRVCVLSDDDEGAVSNLDILAKVNESGTDQALREGIVGRFKGFSVYRGSNVIGVGSPASRKNLFFHRDAFALVIRPLATAAGITPGAIQSVGVDPDAGLSVRLTISYNPTLLSTQVTVDILYGVKTLDEKLAVLANASF